MKIAGRRLKRSAGMALILLVASSLAVACTGEPESELASGEVVLYTSMPAPIVDRLQGVVERRFPDLDGNYWLPSFGGISLRVVRGRTADIQRLIADEVASGGVQADVIWLAEPSPYETYKDMGLLAPYTPPEDAPILPGYIDPDGFYVAGRVISMVVAWNTALCPEGMADWTDLQHADSIAFPAPESGAARATIKALMETQGPEFFTNLSHVGGVSVASNGDARDGLVAGTFEAVGVLDYMARQAKADGSDVDFVYPASGTAVIPSPIALTADAANPGAAKAFVDFILSRAGQEIVVQIGNFFPVRADVAPPAGAPPLDSITALEVDWKALAEGVDAISTFWEELYGPPVVLADTPNKPPP